MESLLYHFYYHSLLPKYSTVSVVYVGFPILKIFMTLITVSWLEMGRRVLISSWNLCRMNPCMAGSWRKGERAALMPCVLFHFVCFVFNYLKLNL